MLVLAPRADDGARRSDGESRPRPTVPLEDRIVTRVVQPRAPELSRRERGCSVQRFGAWSRVALGGPGAGVAEEVAQREAVDAFAYEGACEGVALVVEAEALRDARDCLGGREVALDR